MYVFEANINNNNNKNGLTKTALATKHDKIFRNGLNTGKKCSSDYISRNVIKVQNIFTIK